MNAEIYDKNNIFAKILRGEIPCKRICESAHSLAFYDINPQAPHHALVICKGPYCSFAYFAKHASDAEITDWIRLIGETARLLGVEESGYRLINNISHDAVQEVPHLHMHVVGGRRLGRILPPEN